MIHIKKLKGEVKDMKVSVCMATYNGEKYLKKQIDSIILNLGIDDELIVSDDGSTDHTKEIVNSYVKNDKRIHLINGPQCGVIRNFENAIKESKGDIIFLSDQDDIWDKNKVKFIKKCFIKKRVAVVIHDADVIDCNGNIILSSYFQWRKSQAGVLKNIVKNSYIGCCMAFRKELLKYILPFPSNIEMHDQWIGILGDLYGGTYFLNRILFHYRRHDNNVSSLKHYTIGKMIKNRYYFCLCLLLRIIQLKRKDYL